MTGSLRDRGERAREWLFDQALPVWSERGVNPRGGFHDRLEANLEPSSPGTMRLRVQARQLYVFAEAGRLGWSGSWRPLVEHGLVFLLHRATREDGLVASAFDSEGAVVAGEPELYDQAFALFAYAHAFEVLGDPRARTAALTLRAALAPHGHPLGGFREPSRPGLGSNAHMHLFEAVLAWERIDRDPEWTRLADDLATLCATRLSPEGGGVREHFDDDWRPSAGARGELVEPGHQFEWAWLLLQSGRPQAELAASMCERAELVGVDHRRKVVLNAVDVRGGVVDGAARLWPQTERLKATLALSRSAGDPWPERAAEAFDGLFSYIEPAPSGLWYDLMDEHGRVREEPAPASSFYHVMGALSGLLQETGPW